MYIYLRSNKASKCVPGVTLEDGYRPVVDGVGKNLQLEPAIWFKSLIIDSILIDCDRRVIRWGKAKVTESAIHQEYAGTGLERSLLLEPDNVVRNLHMNKSVFEDADCYDFDPKPDELFEFAKAMLENKSASNQKDNDFKTEVLRLLHCYILPSIMLSEDDIPSLQSALLFTERKFKGIDAEIVSKDRAVLLTDNSLCKQRETLLQNEKFIEESYVRQCNPNFLKKFLSHIEKDIEGKGVELRCAQENVNRLKAKTDLPKEEEGRLADARKERDKFYDTVVHLQEVRECIKNVQVRPRQGKKSKSFIKKKKENVFHEIYLEISSRLVSEKEHIHKLCLQKVKISSVREAIQIAIQELKTEGKTVGWQGMSVGIKTVTDVLGTDGTPEAWYTLEQRISIILDDASSEITKRHWKFCNTICDKVDASLNEQNFFLDMRPNFSDAPQDTRERSTSDGFIDIEPAIMRTIKEVCRERRPSCKRSTSEDSQNTRHTLPFLSLVETIKSDINEHSTDMVARLIQILPDQKTNSGTVTQNMYNKIWTCYQLHLHSKIMEKLEKLYEIAFNKISSKIYRKVEELSLGELGVDEPWLMSIIQNNNNQFDVNSNDDIHATEEKHPIDIEMSETEQNSHRMNSVTSGLSVVLGNMTLDELYSCANGECAMIDKEISHHEETGLKFLPIDHGETRLKFVDGDSPQEDANACSNIRRPPPYDSCHSCPPVYEETDVFDQSDKCQDMPPPYSETNNQRKQTPLLLSESLKPGVTLLKSIIEERSVLGKMKQITKCYRFVGNEVGVLKSTSVENYMGCCDELLTMLIVLLTYLDENSFIQLYAHMKIVIDLMPQFMIGSVHDCSLTNFHAAFQYLSDRLLLRENSSTCIADNEG